MQAPIVRMLGMFGLGAGVMYLLDPRTGRRRRAVMRDGVTHAVTAERRLIGKARRDLGHRVHGAVERIRHPTTADVADEVLAERVRAAIGRTVSHPGAIEVAVCDRCVTLCGPVLEREAENLLDRIASVPGVDGVFDQLVRHRTQASIPGLQGSPRARRESITAMWRPGPRVALGALGAAMLLSSLRGRGAIGALARVIGGALAIRALTNRPLRQLVGTTELEVEKTITIHAPRALVFALWTRIEEFPRFMHHVRRVQMIAGDPQRSRWIVDGPLGARTSFDTRITRLEQDRALAWTTTTESPIQHAGTIHFEDVEDGTRVHIQMRYRPPGGLLGHALARLVGADPRSRMHDDLVRAKALLERGRTSAHHQRVSLHEVVAVS